MQKRTFAFVAGILALFAYSQYQIFVLQRELQELRDQSSAPAAQVPESPYAAQARKYAELQTSKVLTKPAPLSSEPTETPHPDDIFNVRMPHKIVGGDGLSGFVKGEIQTEPLTQRERLRYLELKSNGFTSWSNHYDMAAHVENVCSSRTTLEEFDPACKEKQCPGLFDHVICLDNLKPFKNPDECGVYDFGIREQPQFGVIMHNHFGCTVHAFDPSPVSTSYYKRDPTLKSMKNYHFHDYGVAGRDGNVDLYEYNWGQVSMVRYPIYTRGATCFAEDKTHCEQKNPSVGQKTFKLPVKTLSTIMKELGHRHVNMIKLDVEGAEFAFLEQIFDTFGCPPCDQLTLEWHHFPLDSRYGAGSSPPINAINTVLRKCGFVQFHHHVAGGWPAGEAYFYQMGLHDIRYNLATYIRKEKFKA